VGRVPRVVAQGETGSEEADEAVQECCESLLQQLIAYPTRARCGLVGGRR